MPKFKYVCFWHPLVALKMTSDNRSQPPKRGRHFDSTRESPGNWAESIENSSKYDPDEAHGHYDYDDYLSKAGYASTYGRHARQPSKIEAHPMSFQREPAPAENPSSKSALGEPVEESREMKGILDVPRSNVGTRHHKKRPLRYRERHYSRTSSDRNKGQLLSRPKSEPGTFTDRWTKALVNAEKSRRLERFFSKGPKLQDPPITETKLKRTLSSNPLPPSKPLPSSQQTSYSAANTSKRWTEYTVQSDMDHESKTASVAGLYETSERLVTSSSSLRSISPVVHSGDSRDPGPLLLDPRHNSVSSSSRHDGLRKGDGIDDYDASSYSDPFKRFDQEYFVRALHRVPEKSIDRPLGILGGVDNSQRHVPKVHRQTHLQQQEYSECLDNPQSYREASSYRESKS